MIDVTTHKWHDPAIQDEPYIEVLRLRDSRDLGWLEVGDAQGIAVFAFHGSPGLGRQFAVYDPAARECGVRLIAVDRPGYGRSSYQSRRLLREWPADVRQLADFIGLERFAVIGHSAGGPHALACARFLPERVLGCGVLSGAASQATSPLTEGMIRTNRMQVAVYRHWPQSWDAMAAAVWKVTSPLLNPVLGYGRRHPEQGLERMLRMMPPRDVEVMSRPEVRRELLSEVQDFDSRVVRTSVQDMAIVFRDWGFSIEDIEVPVHFWHGDSDRNVPISHAYYQAEDIPCATVHDCPGEGHWLLVDHMPEVLRTVTNA